MVIQFSVRGCPHLFSLPLWWLSWEMNIFRYATGIFSFLVSIQRSCRYIPYTYDNALTRLQPLPLHRHRVYTTTLPLSSFYFRTLLLLYHHTTASKTMCTTYQICYLPCKREGYGRGPEENMPCIDEDFRQCKHAIESGEGCLEPVVRSIWIEYKCPQHGGLEPQKREELMRERGLQGRDRQIVVKKGDRPSAWNSAVCSIM